LKERTHHEGYEGRENLPQRHKGHREKRTHHEATKENIIHHRGTEVAERTVLPLRDEDHDV
jgi:hypothetical protein